MLFIQFGLFGQALQMSGYLLIKQEVNSQHGISMEVSLIRDLPRQPPEEIMPEPRQQAALSTSQGQNP